MSGKRSSAGSVRGNVLTLLGRLSIAVWISTVLVAILMTTIGTVRPRILEENRVVSVCLDVLLKILRTLKSLATEFTSVGLQRDVDTNVRCDVIALHNSDATIAPSTGQVEVVSTFATNMAFAYVILWRTVIRSPFIAVSI